MLRESLGEIQRKVTRPRILRTFASTLCSALVLSPIAAKAFIAYLATPAATAVIKAKGMNPG